jgi:hypothetical protein
LKQTFLQTGDERDGQIEIGATASGGGGGGFSSRRQFAIFTHLLLTFYKATNRQTAHKQTAEKSQISLQLTRANASARGTGHGTRDTGHGTRDHGTRDTGHVVLGPPSRQLPTGDILAIEASSVSELGVQADGRGWVPRVVTRNDKAQALDHFIVLCGPARPKCVLLRLDEAVVNRV